MVLEGDNFCENCGRDLSLHPDQAEFPASELSALADYALICGLAAPLGIPLGMPWSLSIGAVGVVFGVWAIARIRASRGDLTGTFRALAGIIAAVFWLLVIGVVGG
jgi:hypothetical protein